MDEKLSLSVFEFNLVEQIKLMQYARDNVRTNILTRQMSIPLKKMILLHASKASGVKM